MTKSIFGLEKSDIEKYIADKGIQDCPLCQSKNTIEPVYDDDLKIIFNATNLQKYNASKNILETEMNGFEIIVTCSHCGCLNYIAPGNIIKYLHLVTSN